VQRTQSYRFQTQHRQILPMRVISVDKINLPRPVPVLQLFLPRNRRRHVGEQFIMHKSVDRIFGRVTRRKVVAMLIYAVGQVRRHADVKRAITLARKDIDARLFFFSHRFNNAAKWTLKQVQGDGFFNNQRQYHIPRHPELVSGSIGRLVQCKLRELGSQSRISDVLVRLTLKRAAK
jgi:hypothetical protein